MADEREIIETVLEYIPNEQRQQYRSLVTKLTQRVAKTVAEYHLWEFRNDYEDLTPDSSSSVYTLTADCDSIDQDGVTLLDSSGNPSGKPLVYLSQRQYDELRGTTSAPSDERYYVGLKKLHNKRRIQVLFWPNITLTARVWYWGKATSQDIVHIKNEIMLVSGVLHLMPERLYKNTGQREKEFYKFLGLERRRDTKARAEKLFIRQHPFTSEHNRLMREIQS